ncbi:hypothetical protein BJ741DRAFT_632610 [Chytriomyces cf. hyalinus JEL632]|nr:hypothetical protein BJ741DRAFT_632610 [Chytriomyces cf. hyalinus JEL632]
MLLLVILCLFHSQADVRHQQQARAPNHVSIDHECFLATCDGYAEYFPSIHSCLYYPQSVSPSLPTLSRHEMIGTKNELCRPTPFLIIAHSSNTLSQ